MNKQTNKDMAAKIFRINYKSDFILTLESDAGWRTPFCIKFWTGAPSLAYFVGWDGETYTHCAYDPSEPSKLTVQFDDHHLPIGDLKYQVAYHFTVADFPNDTEDEVMNQASITTEMDGETYQVMLDFNGETAPEIQFALPAYANEAQRIANEEQRIANEQQRIRNEETRIDNEQTRINQESARVNEYAGLKADAIAATGAANDAAALANQKAGLADDAATLATQKAGLAGDAATLATQKAGLADDAATLATQKAGLADDAATLATQKAGLADDAATLATQKAQYAQDEGDYAKAQGDYAKSQADKIPADVMRTASDAAFVNANNEALFYMRQADEHLAGLMTSAEHNKLAALPTDADLETGIIYDVSALHPTSGVSGGSTYASLSAALAVIPQAKRKGGMTVKFVQSSDNTYVQYRLMADEWSANVADWIGVDSASITQWVENTSVNYLTGALVAAQNVKLTQYIPLEQNGCLAKLLTEVNTNNNYGFALYSSANKDSFIPATMFVRTSANPGVAWVYIPKEAHYIRLTYHSTRATNPQVVYSPYSQDEKLAGATPLMFTKGAVVAITNNWTVGKDVTNLRTPAMYPNLRSAVVECSEGDVFSISGWSSYPVYAITDANNIILAVGGKIVQNEQVTIPQGGKMLYITTSVDSPMSYKGASSASTLSLWQGSEDDFDSKPSYQPMCLHVNENGNVLNTDNDSVVRDDLERFMKVSYADDLVNYNYSYAYMGMLKDIPRPVLIPVCTNRTQLYDGAIFKLYDKDNNTVYTETITDSIYKYIVKVWNLQPNETYKWELKNSGDSQVFDKGIITPQGYPRWVKVMDLDVANRVENVRDLGGWKVGWNKSVRYGLIFRGSDMNGTHTIDSDGIDILKDLLGVGYDMDLRGTSEIPTSESPLGNDVTWGNFPVTSYTISDTSGTYYANAIKQIVTNLADDVVTYFHCKSGADRTGTLSALILGILGVSEADLSKEYELTNGRNRNVTTEGRSLYGLMTAIKAYTGSTLQEKIVAWAMEYGVTQTEIDSLQEIMIIES